MNELIEQLKKYVELRLELLKITAVEILINAVASVLLRILLLVISVSCVVMLEIACGLALGSYFDHMSTGFFLISGLNLILLLLILKFQKTIIKLFQDFLSENIDTDELS